MNRTLPALAACILLASCGGGNKELYKMIDTAFANAAAQYAVLADSLYAADPAVLPHSFKPDGTLTTTKPEGWTSGFFPGSLWYIYEYGHDEAFRLRAEEYTSILESQKSNRGTHDIGFMMFCSWGNSWRIVPDSLKAAVLVESAESLASRFNPTVGCIRSWDVEVKPGWHYPVIIDNMMNLELLLWASGQSGDGRYEQIARAHADNTMKNHFRDDNSSFHVVNYDPGTGEVAFRGTNQGFSDDSAWSRGQGWGLYGYTVMYRFTKDERYLNHARSIAGYILNQPNTPEDKVPYWDFFAGTEETGTARDASAAALFASALLELSGYVDGQERDTYRGRAIETLKSLSSPAYTAAEGSNGRFLLRHSTTSHPHGKEIDQPLNYADYYYLEALLRLKAILDSEKS